jgi:hypothetical protein
VSLSLVVASVQARPSGCATQRNCKAQTKARQIDC